MAASSGKPFYSISAVNSGVREVRNLIEKATDEKGAVLFIDEIHRFSKSQQDSLLGAVEKGIITLIGATTENPSFEVIPPLLSRCQVYILEALGRDELLKILEDAVGNDTVLRQAGVRVQETLALLRISGGDARKLLNLLELAAGSVRGGTIVITDELVMETARQKLALYDKKGEQHYDIISAFIKSLRGSDPNAAVYWLARMVAGGEDPLFIARRMVIFASEDIGNANPTALVLASSCFQAVHSVGMPEGRIILSQTAVYLASSVKSNASYTAIKKAESLVHESGDLPVPLHLRNAPTRLMEELGYGKEYRYAHDFKGNFTDLEFFPESLTGTTLYEPGENKRETEIRERLRTLWGKKYGY